MKRKEIYKKQNNQTCPDCVHDKVGWCKLKLAPTTEGNSCKQFKRKK